jgi:hypothetical protein
MHATWVHTQPHPIQALEESVAVVLLVLLLALVLGGLGFAAHIFWLFALIAAALWIAGFAFRSGEGRWYRW